MRGRKRKRVKLKIVHGQLPPNKAKAGPPPPTGGIPEPFDWMSEVGKREWQRVAPQLAARGLLTHLDQHCLAAYCECVANYIDAKETVEREGSTYTAANGLVKKHPAVGIRDQAARDMAMFARELGLVPTARQRLGADDPGDDDPLADFLKDRIPSA